LSILPSLFQVFEDWNKTELDSYLIEITSQILQYQDDKGEYLVEKIRDAAGQKGTGKWTAISALTFGMPVTLIGESVFARCLSALKSERVEASKSLKGPDYVKYTGDKQAFIEAIRKVRIVREVILRCLVEIEIETLVFILHVYECIRKDRKLKSSHFDDMNE